MSRTFSNKIRVRGSHKRAATNERRPRISQTRITSRNMPATIIHKAWLNDGTQIAICQVNDTYVAARFDAREQIIGTAVEFKYGHGRDSAFAWAKKQQDLARGF